MVRGGENISLCEIEEAIAEYVGVDATKAFGIPSADLGERSDCRYFCVQKATALVKVNYVNFYSRATSSLQNPQRTPFLYRISSYPLRKKLMCRGAEIAIGL